VKKFSKSVKVINRQTVLQGLRWIASTLFFFLAINKTVLLYKYGLQPYKVIIAAAKLPEIIAYYGIVAVAIELYLATGVWVKSLYKSAVLSAGLLSLGGTVLSLYFIIFKLTAECGCGLLGDSEYALLTQKLIILLGLGLLYKSKNLLFVADEQR